MHIQKFLHNLFLIGVILLATSCANKINYQQENVPALVLPADIEYDPQGKTKLPQYDPILLQPYPELPMPPAISATRHSNSQLNNQKDNNKVILTTNLDRQPCLKLTGNKRESIKKIINAIATLQPTNYMPVDVTTEYILDDNNKLIIYTSSNAVYIVIKDPLGKYVESTVAINLLKGIYTQIKQT